MNKKVWNIGVQNCIFVKNILIQNVKKFYVKDKCVVWCNSCICILFIVSKIMWYVQMVFSIYFYKLKCFSLIFNNVVYWEFSWLFVFVRVIKCSIVDKCIVVVNVYSVSCNWCFIIVFSDNFVLKIRFSYGYFIMFCVFFKVFCVFFNNCFVCFFFSCLYMFVNFVECIMQCVVVNLRCLICEGVFQVSYNSVNCQFVKWI